MLNPMSGRVFILLMLCELVLGFLIFWFVTSRDPEVIWPPRYMFDSSGQRVIGRLSCQK